MQPYIPARLTVGTGVGDIFVRIFPFDLVSEEKKPNGTARLSEQKAEKNDTHTDTDDFKI